MAYFLIANQRPMPLKFDIINMYMFKQPLTVYISQEAQDKCFGQYY